MKIGIVGCGALGSYYGACLARAGNDVHFLLRSDLEAVRAAGIQILSPNGDFHVRPKPAAFPQEIGVCDLVVIGLKTTANGEFPSLIPPLVGPHTAVLTLQNGLGSEEALAALIPTEQILGGLCFVCINRVQPGVIRHIAHGRIVLGQFQHPPDARTHQIAQAFRDSGVPCEVAEDLGHAHWQKLVWNVPFNGLGVASAAGLAALDSGYLPSNQPLAACLSSDQLLAHPAWEARVRQLMREVILTARALGHPIPDDYAQFQVERTLEMGPYFASTILDFIDGRPLEIQTLFIEPWLAATRAGVPVPGLTALCRILCALASRHGQNVPFPSSP
jgi:2-dehydropantoate 2-reductase